MDSTRRTCLVCHHDNEISATKCTRCGAPLRVGKTMHITDKQTTDNLRDSIQHTTRVPFGSIAVYFVGKTEPLMVEARSDIVLGRHSPGEAAPDLDLTPYHAGLLGVSRNHAIIRPYNRGYTIEDLESTNGTWINERRIDAKKPQQLYSGDQIRLGQLILVVHYSA